MFQNVLMKTFSLVVSQASSADCSHWAGEWDLPTAKWKENWGSSGDQQHIWRIGATAASSQDRPHHRPGEHLQQQAKGLFNTIIHIELLFYVFAPPSCCFVYYQLAIIFCLLSLLFHLHGCRSSIPSSPPFFRGRSTSRAAAASQSRLSAMGMQPRWAYKILFAC